MKGFLLRLLRSEHAPVVPVICLAVAIRLFLLYSVPYITKSDETLYAHMAYYALYWSRFGFWEERSYFYPMILLSAIVFAHPEISGVWDPSLLMVTRAFSLALNILSVLLTYLVGRSLGGRGAGLVASFLLSICWLDAFWGFRPVSEVPATLFLLLSLLFAVRGLLLNSNTPNSNTRFLLAGLFLGFSFMARFPSLLLFIPFMLVLARRGRYLRHVFYGLVLAVLMQGVVDLISLGVFLGSPWRFFALNILSRGSVRWGSRPLSYYLERIPEIIGWSGLIMAFLALLSMDDCVSLLWLSIIVHVGVFSFVAHKERRFLVPIVPLFYVLAATGFARISGRLSRRLYQALLLLLLTVPEVLLCLDIIMAIATYRFLTP